MRLILLILLVALNCDAQYLQHRRKAFRPAAAAPAFNPSTITGYPCNDWWPGDNYDGTTWANSGSSGISLTNLNATHRPSTTTVNGHTVLVFDGTDDTLKAALWSNTSVAGTEMVMAVAFDWTGLTARRIWSDKTSINCRLNVTTGVMYWRAGNGPLLIPTNLWMVVNLTASTASAGAIYTNNVQYFSSGALAALLTDGIQISGRYSDDLEPTAMRLGEVIIYNTNLSTAVRTQVYDYLTNKYSIPAP